MITLVRFENGAPTAWILARNLAEAKLKTRAIPRLGEAMAVLREPLPVDRMLLPDGTWLLGEPVSPPNGRKLWGLPS